MTMASSSEGNTSRISITRMMVMSTIPPANAAVSPSVVPTTSASEATESPMSRDSRAP